MGVELSFTKHIMTAYGEEESNSASVSGEPIEAVPLIFHTQAISENPEDKANIAKAQISACTTHKHKYRLEVL